MLSLFRLAAGGRWRYPKISQPQIRELLSREPELSWDQALAQLIG